MPGALVLIYSLPQSQYVVLPPFHREMKCKNKDNSFELGELSFAEKKEVFEIVEKERTNMEEKKKEKQILPL